MGESSGIDWLVNCEEVTVDAETLEAEMSKTGGDSTMRTARRLPPIPPGAVLRDILGEAGLSVNALATALRVPANRIGQRGITADTALRLARYFGTSAQMWIHLQANYELAVAEDALRGRIERAVLPRSAA